MFEIIYPFSYAGVLVGFCIGIGITSVILGFISTSLMIVLIYIGIIRITPLLDIFTSLLKLLMPRTISKSRENIQKSFKVRFTDPDKDLSDNNYIYAWHPHGVFSTSHFFHIATKLTEWPLRNIKGVSLSALYWLPFGKDIFEYLTIVPSDYYPMKEELEKGNSISVAVGGMREMLGDDFIIKRRRGIFKMALETGTSIVPIISFGEQKLFSIVQIPHMIQDFLEPYDVCICIPTLQSVRKWLGLLYSPLKDPIISVVGTPVLVEKISEPTEDDISNLREKYIAALKDLFEKESMDTSDKFSVI